MTHSEYYDLNDQIDDDAKRAILWAKTTLDRSFHILDTETTGLDNHAEAVEIAIIKSDGTEVFNSRIKPINPIPRSATAIHGISNTDVINAPLFEQYYPTIKLIIESMPVIIYNAAFDIRIINQQCHMNGLPNIKFDSQCAMNWYSQYYGDWSHSHQSYTWQRLPGGDHSALGDCRATLAVIKEMANG